jgi:non-specific serine/threonine protein kinase
VGRDQECARARTLLERARWVTLVGPGGVGKTRLAVEVALGRGAVFVDLAPVRSVDLLDAPSAQVFRRLAVFAGRFTTDAAAQVCAEPGTDVTAALATLVDHSLVTAVREPSGSGHRLLDTVREQAWVLLDEHGEVDALRRRHLAWVARLAGIPRPPTVPLDVVELVDRVEAALDDVRAALEPRSVEDRVTALAVAAGLYRVWDMRGYLSEGRRHLERLLQDTDADPRPEKALVASGWDALGLLALWQDDHDTARRALARSARLFAEAGDDGAWAWSSASLVMSHCMRGDDEGVEPLAERALAVAGRSGDTAASSRALCALALVRRARGARASSVALMAEGLALHPDMPWVRGKFSYFLGWFALLDGELDRAGELLSTANAEFERIGDRRSLPDALDALGCLAELRGAAQHAVLAFDAGRALRERAGSRRHPYLAERADPAERRARAVAAGPTATARELEVARLVALGHTNRQIGRRLSISERTAERHVENLRAKLGVGTRAQIAAWVSGTAVPTNPRAGEAGTTHGGTSPASGALSP